VWSVSSLQTWPMVLQHTRTRRCVYQAAMGRCFLPTHHAHAISTALPRCRGRNEHCCPYACLAQARATPTLQMLYAGTPFQLKNTYFSDFSKGLSDRLGIRPVGRPGCRTQTSRSHARSFSDYTSMNTKLVEPRSTRRLRPIRAPRNTCTHRSSDQRAVTPPVLMAFRDSWP
jgi:hypothetical protein